MYDGLAAGISLLLMLREEPRVQPCDPSSMPWDLPLAAFLLERPSSHLCSLPGIPWSSKTLFSHLQLFSMDNTTYLIPGYFHAERRQQDG